MPAVVHTTTHYMCHVYMDYVKPINRPLALLISFYSGYEGVGKAISVHEQVLAI